MEILFIGQYVSIEESLTSPCYSQASNLYQKKFLKFTKPKLAISIIPIFVNKKKKFEYPDYPVNFINNPIIGKSNKALKILRILKDTKQTLKLIMDSKIRDIWIYNITMATFLIALYLKVFTNKRLFVLIADYSFSKTNIFTIMINSVLKKCNGAIVWNSNIKHDNRVVLPDILDESAIKIDDSGILKRKVLFSGSLGKTTGFEKVLDYFNTSTDLELYITGRPYEYSEDEFNALIDKFVTPNENIKYLGLLPIEEYYDVINSIDIALSFRDPKDIQHDGNFPSKILEYLSFSKFVISSKMYPDIDSNIYFYTELDDNSIDETFNRILKMSEKEVVEKREYIFNYLMKNHTQSALISAMNKVAR